MLHCYFKLPQKDKGVPQIAVSSSFCRSVAKFFSYEQALLVQTQEIMSRWSKGAFISIPGVGEMLHLLMGSHGFAKVSQEVVGVAEVTVGSPLSGAVSELLHYTQICPVNTKTVKRCCTWRTAGKPPYCAAAHS